MKVSSIDQLKKLNTLEWVRRNHLSIPSVMIMTSILQCSLKIRTQWFHPLLFKTTDLKLFPTTILIFEGHYLETTQQIRHTGIKTDQQTPAPPLTEAIANPLKMIGLSKFIAAAVVIVQLDVITYRCRLRYIRRTLILHDTYNMTFD